MSYKIVKADSIELWEGNKKIDEIHPGETMLNGVRIREIGEALALYQLWKRIPVNEVVKGEW